VIRVWSPKGKETTMKMMMKSMMAGALVSLGAMAAAGGANAAACVSEPLGPPGSDYLAPGFNCTIDDKTFNNFSYIQNNGPAAGSVVMNPFMSGNSEGFTINGGFIATPGMTVDLFSAILWRQTMVRRRSMMLIWHSSSAPRTVASSTSPKRYA
jgi:hypothetical protein